MESQLVYIIRGLPKPLDHSVVEALRVYLVEKTSFKLGVLMERLEAASTLMIPRKEYDIYDFDSQEIDIALSQLLAGDEIIWAQLLDALNDSRSPDFEDFKEVSPFRGQHLMFFDIADDPANMTLDLDVSAAREILGCCDVHDFPGNSGMIVLSDEDFKRMRFVDCVDNIPATI